MPVVTQYDHVQWDRFFRGFKWDQGEHLTAIAPTGGGKTTLLAKILPRRRFTVVFVTKAHDPTFQRQFPGYRRVREWKDVGPYDEKVLLWPSALNRSGGTRGFDLDSFKRRQKRVFKEALNRIFMERNTCVVIDEQHYMSADLGMRDVLATYVHQGRSSGLTVVTGIQRPKFVPLITYSSSRHAFIWRTTDEDDMKRLSALGGVDRKEVAANMLTLGRHEFIYVDQFGDRPPVRSQVRF